MLREEIGYERSSQPGPINVQISHVAMQQMTWMTKMSDNEISAIGLFSVTDKSTILIERMFIPSQIVSPSSIQIDTKWWADKIVDLFDTEGIQPYQTNCWFHTHPRGFPKPSSKDEETMRSLGDANLFVMLIMTKGMDLYCRVDFTVSVGNKKMKFSQEVVPEIYFGEIDSKWMAEAMPLIKEGIPPFQKKFKANGGKWGGEHKHEYMEIENMRNLLEDLGINVERECIERGYDPNDKDGIRFIVEECAGIFLE